MADLIGQLCDSPFIVGMDMMEGTRTQHSLRLLLRSLCSLRCPFCQTKQAWGKNAKGQRREARQSCGAASTGLLKNVIKLRI